MAWSYYCGWCGEKAKKIVVSRHGEPRRMTWAPSCAHAVHAQRFGPKQAQTIREEYAARQAYRRERQNKAIADCAGEPA